MFGGYVMSKGPIMKFTEETLQKSLQWWQKKLFLNDWNIKAKLVPQQDIDGCAGTNEFEFINKSSLIRIAVIPDEARSEFITKVCDECTLVHELLHCKYNWEEGSGLYEQMYVDTMEHQKLEQLAKTLIMVKYNLPFKWFNNK